MNWKDRWRYKTRTGKWWYKLDAECKLIFFAMVNLALVLMLWGWDAWIR